MNYLNVLGVLVLVIACVLYQLSFSPGVDKESSKNEEVICRGYEKLGPTEFKSWLLSKMQDVYKECMSLNDTTEENMIPCLSSKWIQSYAPDVFSFNKARAIILRVQESLNIRNLSNTYRNNLQVPGNETLRKISLIVPELVYHSEKLEGNSLSEDETRQLLMNNKSPNRSADVNDIICALNHQSSFEQILDNLEKKPSHESMKTLQMKLFQGIRDFPAHFVTGNYRDHNVVIPGTLVLFPEHQAVALLMESYLGSINRELEFDGSSLALNELEIAKSLSVAVVAHVAFIRIHPFSDGNGRLSRIIMNGLLMRLKFPPIVIPSQSKSTYFCLLQGIFSQEESAWEDFIQFMMDLLVTSLKRFQ